MLKSVIIFILLLITVKSNLISMTTDDFLSMDIAKQRTNLEGCRNLLIMISNELAKNPNSDEMNWLYASMHYFIGDYYETDAEKKKESFNKTRLFALKAISINSNNTDAHYWYGVGLGKWAEANGILDSLFTAADIKDEMTRVVKRRPDFFRGVAWGIRAKVYNLAPGWPLSVGDKEQSYKDIQEAYRYGPDFRFIYQMHAEMLINDGRYREARRIIQQGLALPFELKYQTEDARIIRDLKTDLKIANERLGEDQ